MLNLDRDKRTVSRELGEHCCVKQLNEKCNTTEGSELVIKAELPWLLLYFQLCDSVCYHQIRALDKMTVERVSAERSECLQRMEQRAVQERLETEKRQVTLTWRQLIKSSLSQTCQQRSHC